MDLSPDIVQALVKTIELKDLSTAAHTWRVVLYTRVMAESMGLSHELTERLSVAAALHDIGKIDIPDNILQKPGKLTSDEFDVIKTHPVLGHERLVRMGETDEAVLSLVRHHHERPDGNGYPDKQANGQIHVAARYFAVVDTFDALTSVRPYRNEVGHEAGVAAIKELRDNSGPRYCEECVSTFAKLFESGKLEWILEHFNDTKSVPAFEGQAGVEKVAKQLKV